jgi:hypothetical protein
MHHGDADNAEGPTRLCAFKFRFLVAHSRLLTRSAVERGAWYVDFLRAGRPLGRIAAELRLQFQQSSELVRLAAQFVGNYWRVA